MSDFRRLSDSFSASPQLAKADFQAARDQGFAMIINNRPDNEEPGQMSSAEARAETEAAGLAYESIPMEPGQVTPEMVAKMGACVENAGGPVLAYCRSGARSTMLWALDQAGSGKMNADELSAAAQSAGYDLSPLKPQLEAMSAQAKS